MRRRIFKLKKGLVIGLCFIIISRNVSANVLAASIGEANQFGLLEEDIIEEIVEESCDNQTTEKPTTEESTEEITTEESTEEITTEEPTEEITTEEPTTEEPTEEPTTEESTEETTTEESTEETTEESSGGSGLPSGQGIIGPRPSQPTTEEPTTEEPEDPGPEDPGPEDPGSDNPGSGNQSAEEVAPVEPSREDNSAQEHYLNENTVSSTNSASNNKASNLDKIVVDNVSIDYFAPFLLMTGEITKQTGPVDIYIRSYNANNILLKEEKISSLDFFGTKYTIPRKSIYVGEGITTLEIIGVDQIYGDRAILKTYHIPSTQKRTTFNLTTAYNNKMLNLYLGLVNEFFPIVDEKGFIYVDLYLGYSKDNREAYSCSLTKFEGAFVNGVIENIAVPEELLRHPIYGRAYICFCKNGEEHNHLLDTNGVQNDIIQTIDFDIKMDKILTASIGGSTAKDIPQEKVPKKASIVTVGTPVRPGYKFEGWYEETELKNRSLTVSEGKNSNTTMYAKWVPIEYNVTFDGNGGMVVLLDKIYQYDKNYTLPKGLEIRPGYKFIGWNTKKDGSGDSYPIGGNIRNLTTVEHETVTLYAQWRSSKRVSRK